MSGPRVDLSFLVPRFLARLDERLRRVSASLDTISGLTGEPIESLMREFHSLAGIGGTYGFPEVTGLAREGELLASVALFEERPLRSAEMAALRAAVSQLDEIRLQAEAELRCSSAEREPATPDQTENAAGGSAAPRVLPGPLPFRSESRDCQCDLKLVTR